MTLPAPDAAIIAGLSRQDLATTAAGLSGFVASSRWLGINNGYAKDIVRRLKDTPPSTNVRRRKLAQYIAASVALHASDGWSYLGRSVACLLAGDAHRALHMAYYAELRAAMSLLASEGVGIFNHEHYVVHAANDAQKLVTSAGTHVSVWLALKHWAQQAASGSLFAKIIRPNGQTLDDWFQPLGGINVLAPQAQAWFTQWGMDLDLASKDRLARNESSYRPDGITQTWSVSAKDGFDFVLDTWAAFEPSSMSSFEQIDRHILRIALERHFQGLTGRAAVATDPVLVKMVNDMLKPQALPSAVEDGLRRFLLRQAVAQDPLIFQYAGQAPNGSAADVFSTASRAILLLRAATGSAYDLLQGVGFKAQMLEFWWGRVGESRGLWPPGSPPSSLTDLWADIEASLQDVAAAQAADPAAFGSMDKVAFGVELQLALLSSHDRVGLWGLCPP